MFFSFSIFSSFIRQYGQRVQSALPFAMNSEFSRVLSGQMVSNLWRSSAMAGGVGELVFPLRQES